MKGKHNQKEIEMIVGLYCILFAIAFVAAAVFIADPHLFIEMAEEIKDSYHQFAKPKGKHFA